MKLIQCQLRLLIVTLLVSAILLTSCGGSSDSDINYVALGASDATGVGADPINRGYVYVISKSLNDKGKSTKLTNLGIPSARIHLIGEAARGITRIENPDLITIFVGANDLNGGDSAASFEAELDGMLDHLVGNTDAFIVIATLPDLTQLPSVIDKPNPNVTKATLAAYNDAILNQAAKYNAAIADLRSLKNTGDVTASDGFHPNNEGYQKIADVFLGVIEPRFLTTRSATLNAN